MSPRPAWTSRAAHAGLSLLSVISLLTGGLTVTSEAPAAATPIVAVKERACSTHLPAADAVLTQRPVILVHGWISNAAAMEGLADLISKGVQPYFLYCFDYASLTSKWPQDPSIHQQLANEIVALSKAYKRGGGDGMVLAAGHSMGGIAIRYASQDSFDGVKVGDVLAGVVTLGTPHMGSPWGGTGPARALEVAAGKLNGVNIFPPADTDAAACLATLSRRAVAKCGQIPYLPEGVRLTELGTQIFVRRTLFNIGFIKGPSADIALFGDGVVPQDSSTGYIKSGPMTGGSRRIPYRATVGIEVATCRYDTDYILAAKSGAKVGGGGLFAVIGALTGVLANEVVDSKAADRLLQGKASSLLAQLTAYAAFTPCFHTNLTTQPKLAAATIAAFQADINAQKPKQFTSDAKAIADYVQRTYPGRWRGACPDNVASEPSGSAICSIDVGLVRSLGGGYVYYLAKQGAGEPSGAILVTPVPAREGLVYSVIRSILLGDSLTDDEPGWVAEAKANGTLEECPMGSAGAVVCGE